ncbi:MAG: VanW family protein [Oscillatoriophycideae cyanobacterium NC_groundwater_1537_Pr4_S-0.65um_50_18]|nr:VanW family protein [Oscillatoriophycideae cyanobacterium NC_groundwater_1537_Pr4_S-0.65um_50_18]
MKDWKRSLRTGCTYAKNLFYGYPFYYARQQTPQQSHLYPYLWCESATAIPDRGSPEIRKNRLFNLQLATSKIHQLQLNSGQIFSFCHRVGDPTVENGFQEGYVFVGGQVQTGVGGGLCLIATNLFHLFLISGCQILERHCHSIDAYGVDRFYQLGQDASIAYGYKDLVIRNQSAVGVQLRLQVLPDAGQVISSLWGQSPCPWQVKVNSVVLQELPSPWARGISGWIVATQRHVCDCSEDLRAKPRSKSRLEKLAWQLDYHIISIYNPCGDRSEQAVKRS